MKIIWGKNLSSQLDKMGLLRDYKGINDPDVEMEWISQ